MQPASPDAFEGHLRRSDDIGDRLRAEADSVALQRPADGRRRGAWTTSGVCSCSASNSSPRTAPSIERRWTEAWAPTGIAPASPREMADWLRARQTVIERADTVARRRRNLEAEQRTRDGQIETLKAQLSALGQETAGLSTLSSVARDGPGTSGPGAERARGARTARRVTCAAQGDRRRSARQGRRAA